MPDLPPSLTAALADRYRIERELGEGGMATVYLARDLKHDRDVAIKVLKPELAAVLGAERFVAEIRTTANLLHPHILPLHDSGEADGSLYFVTPYVEGETLRQRLDRQKQLSVEDVVRIARAVASALQAAHEHGVVHRDIKPANILLSGGEPLVADFGIALAVSEAGGKRLTETGLSVGTPYYMSPEQATGDQEVGPQSDVYALGCVTYEMLVGDPPYVGSTTQAVLGKILTETPKAPSAVRAVVPPNVEGAVLKALEKLPADRFPTAQAFGEALADPSFRYGASGMSAGTARVVGRLWKTWAVAATVVALGALALRGRALGVSSSVGYYFDVTIPPDISHVTGPGVDFDISPDGSRVVLVAQDSMGTQDLWVRATDWIDPVRLEGTGDARNPRFSPDGESVAYISGDSLRTMSLTGAPPVTVVRDSVTGGLGGGGLAWGSDGYLYFTRVGGGVWRAPANGGRPERLLPADSTGSDDGGAGPGGGGGDAWFDALPDGKGILFSITNALDATRSRVAVLNLHTRRATVLLKGAMARFAPPGDLLYTTAEGQLLAVPFDADRLEVTGSPRPVVDGIQVNTGSASYFAASGSGALLYATGRLTDLPKPIWISTDGSTAPLPGVPEKGRQSLRAPRVSPHGRRVAFAVGEGGPVSDIWIYDLAQQTLSPLTRDAYADAPFWSPDGTEIGYRSRAPGAAGIYARRADFTGQARRLVPAATGASGSLSTTRRLYASAYTAVWMPDGRALLYADSAGRLLYASLGAPAAPRAVLGPGATVLAFSVSADGRWVAYESDVSGSSQIYVAPVAGPGGRVQVSVEGGTDPVWTRDGSGIVYVGPGGTAWMLATVRTRPAFAVASRRKLADASDYFGGRNFDTAPDGRIVALSLNKLESQDEIRFVTDWRRAFKVGR